MLLANTGSGRTTATPGTSGACPMCMAPLIPKCGLIKQWHWAHLASTECDPWVEHETEWHREWKRCFRNDEIEICLGPHRADVKTARGRILEFQHSTISAIEIQERERFYGPGLVWVVDAEPFLRNIFFHSRDGFMTFYWRWRRPSWGLAKCPVFLDTRDGWLFNLRRIYTDTPCRGWGAWKEANQLLRDFGACQAYSDALLVEINRCGNCARNGSGYALNSPCCFCNEFRPSMYWPT